MKIDFCPASAASSPDDPVTHSDTNLKLNPTDQILHRTEVHVSVVEEGLWTFYRSID